MANINKQIIAKKIISHFLFENEQRYISENKEYIKFYAMNEIIVAIEETYTTKKALQQNEEWVVITETEYNYLKEHSKKKKNGEMIQEGLVIDKEAWISSPTLQIAYNELAEENFFYRDDEGCIRFSIEDKNNKAKLHPILDIASKIDVKTTTYKYMRVLLVDKQFTVSIAKWLNDEFERDKGKAYCIPVENALIIFADFDDNKNPKKSLDNYLKKILKDNSFRLI